MNAATARRACLAALCAVAVGCGGPADVSGTYTAELTNGANGCPGLNNWNVGDRATLMLLATQSGDEVTFDVQGLARVFVEAVLGAHAFTGKVHGDEVAAVLNGTQQQTRDGCEYTFRGNLTGRLDGNTLTGTVTYTPQPTNATAAACQTAMVTGCSAQQTFTATRAVGSGS